MKKLKIGRQQAIAVKWAMDVMIEYWTHTCDVESEDQDVPHCEAGFPVIPADEMPTLKGRVLTLSNHPHVNADLAERIGDNLVAITDAAAGEDGFTERRASALNREYRKLADAIQKEGVTE